MTGVLLLKELYEVMAEHLLQVRVVVVHDSEVLLVHVQLLQGEGNVGESQPESIVGVHLKRLNRSEKDDVAHVKLDLAYRGSVEEDGGMEVLLGNFGARGWQPQDMREGGRHLQRAQFS